MKKSTLALLYFLTVVSVVSVGYVHHTQEMTGTAVGIDLGTTYSCVGVLENGRIKIIPNEEGNHTTPSYVAFTDTVRLVGERAKSYAFQSPSNSIFDAKRLIGRRFDDPVVKKDIEMWPFKVIGRDNKPFIAVKEKGKETYLCPEEISSMVLLKMKTTAEEYLKRKVTKAVITVPAYFNDAQRQATKVAGEATGLEVLRIINEPTAAAIAYGLNKNLKSEIKVLVFDFGGGTFDVSILYIDCGIFQVKATAGNTHLGGEDFDNKLVEFFTEEIKTKYNKDISRNIKAARRLRTECQKAKKILSSSQQAIIQLDSLLEGIDFKSSIKRSTFNKLCSDIFRDAIAIVDRALCDAKLGKDDIDEVVLVGGSTRIPKMQDLLKEHFNGKELNRSINPDEAVAYGAAVQAAILVGDKSKILEDILLHDITPLSLGLETVGGLMTVFIGRNSPIPTRKEKILTTSEKNQQSVLIQIFEGESPLTKHNNLLGRFELAGVPPAPRGVPKILVTFEIDSNGILKVSSKDTLSGKEIKVIITNDKDRLSRDKVQSMIADAERYRREDQQEKLRISARNKLEGYVYSMLGAIKTDKGKTTIAAHERQKIVKKCNEVIDWIELHQNAEKDEFEDQMDELLIVCSPLHDNYED